MRIAIIISGNISKAPYISFYTNFLNEHGQKYDIISWNRIANEEISEFSYNKPESEDKGYLLRLIHYLRYRKHIIQIIEKNNYDKIIIATIAIGVIMFSYLKKNYFEKFIFDIRDYSITSQLFKRTFYNTITKSEGTIISSYGFKLWLPQGKDYIISHNVPYNLSVSNFDSSKSTDWSNNDSIIITNIGSLRDYEANKIIIDSFSDEPRFVLKYIGSGTAYKPLVNYAKKKKSTNIYFSGYYPKEQEKQLLNDANFINNFTNLDLNSRTLTTNRFYLSVLLGIPMIVRNKTYQAQLCEKYSLGCIIKSELNLKNQLFHYIDSFDTEQYNKGRHRFMELVNSDLKKMREFLLGFIQPQ